NVDIATVSDLGIVTAQSPGLAGIAAESEGQVAVARITVLPATVGAAGVSARVQQEETPLVEPPARPAAQRPAGRTPYRPQPLQTPRTAPVFGSVRSEPPPVTERSHEPEGYTPINTRHFRSKAKNDRDRGPNGSEGWSGTESRYGRFTIEHDPSAPTGDS